MLKKIAYSSFVAILLLSGCGSSDKNTTSNNAGVSSSSNEDPVNEAPIVNAGKDKTVKVNETITLVGTANDSDGEISTYEWKKGSVVLGTSVTLEYRPTVVGTDTLTLTVMDDDRASSSDSVEIIVELEDGVIKIDSFE